MKRLIITKNEPTVSLVATDPVDEELHLVAEMVCAQLHVTAMGSLLIHWNYSGVRTIPAIRVTITQHYIIMKVFVEGEVLMETRLQQLLIQDINKNGELYTTTYGRVEMEVMNAGTTDGQREGQGDTSPAQQG